MNKEHNILQYEFFHVGDKNANSLEEVMAECAERINETLPLAIVGYDTGPGMKTVVRVYDVHGQVTNWAKQVEALKIARKVHFDAPRSNLFTNWYAKRQISKLNQKMDFLQRLMVDYITKYIEESFKNDLGIAREVRNHAFRPARRDEYIELAQAAKMAKDFWLFIFEPNDLLADENKGVISMI